jgi:hypothetical protein
MKHPVNSLPVKVTSASGRTTVYASLSAASRVLSGRGDPDAKRRTITRRCNEGGGRVGSSYVSYA